MNNKIIYLKSLIKNYKPKTETFPKDIILELEKQILKMEESIIDLEKNIIQEIKEIKERLK